MLVSLWTVTVESVKPAYEVNKSGLKDKSY